ncbi:hypothetical protein LguiA_030173 [Lonicera macranthoides]
MRTYIISFHLLKTKTGYPSANSIDPLKLSIPQSKPFQVRRKSIDTMKFFTRVSLLPKSGPTLKKIDGMCQVQVT